MIKIQSLIQNHLFGSKYFYFSGRIISGQYFHRIVTWCVDEKKIKHIYI
jgi:hypothetical protein